jgi:hypothetical protein
VKHPPIRSDGLQLEEPRTFQRFFWRLERIAWCVFAFIVLLALLGLTGAGGPFSRATARFSAGSLEYPRIGRWLTPDELRIHPDASGEPILVVLDSDFVESYELQSAVPGPARQWLQPGGVAMEFPAETGARTPIILGIRPRAPGFPTFAVELNGERIGLAAAILP